MAYHLPQTSAEVFDSPDRAHILRAFSANVGSPSISQGTDTSPRTRGRTRRRLYGNLVAPQDRYLTEVSDHLMSFVAGRSEYCHFGKAKWQTTR